MSGPFFRVEKLGGNEVVMDTIPPSLLLLVKSELQKSGTKKISYFGRDVRGLCIQGDFYTVYAVADDEDRLKSVRVLRSEAEVMLASAKRVELELSSARERAENQTRRLIHNLKSLTAKTMQEIYFIAMQDKLMASPKEALDYLEREVKRSPREVAKALIEILKHQGAQKAEFSAFNKLSGGFYAIRKEPHKIHKVLMSVFYLFFNDFTDKRVRVSVSPCDLTACFDYDSVHVCIYHLVDNSAKYIKPGCEFLVSASERREFIDIFFEMESLYIEDDEVERVFEEGFSGKKAVQRQLEGGGVGLFLARQMAKLNGGGLTLLKGGSLPRTPDYGRNKFVLSLPRWD